MPDGDRLPHVDEHETTIVAGTDAAWAALLRVVEGTFSSTATGRFAGLLGCADLVTAGPRPLAAGSAFPGFHVEAAEPAQLLALRGSHRSSDYALIFRLDEAAAQGTRLRAETRAAFPGAKGRLYRALVIGTRVHVLMTRRLLGAVKRRAESTPQGPAR